MGKLVEMLKKNVWYMDRCCGCGACISTCSKNILKFRDEDDHPIQLVREKHIGLSHTTVDTCFFCEKPCEDSCPRLKEWKKGPIIHTVSVVSNLPNVNVINALLVASLRRKLVDGVITWDIERESFRPIPKIAVNEEEVLSTSGFQSLWNPILEVLNKAIYEKKLKKIAVVGPPCVAQAVKAIRNTTNNKLTIYKDSLYLIIGFFCEGVYTHKLVNEIVDRFNVNLYDINTLTVDFKNKVLRVTLEDGLIKGIPLSAIRKYMKPGCMRCIDSTAEWADISVGTVGLEGERTIAIVRTSVGERCMDYALKEKTIRYLEMHASLDEVQKLVVDKERRRRVQEIDSLYALMLESLLKEKDREEPIMRLKSAQV